MKKENKIKGVLFDIGGVLLDFDHMLSCAKLARLCALTPQEVYTRLFTSGLEREFDLGLCPDLFYSKALKLLGISEVAISFDDFGQIWGDIFKERAEVRRVVEGLKGRTRLFILSNTNKLHYSYITKNFQYFNDCFEASFLSFELKQRKPDPAIFASVINSTALPPASILYIDDIPEHVIAAKKAGINAVLYTSAEALRQTLGTVGL